MNKIQLLLTNWRGAILLSLLISTLILGSRALGQFEETEWKFLNWLFERKKPEEVDKRIVIVGLEEKDLQKLETYDEVVSDRTLAQLLKKIKSANPRVIGLDLFRDKPVGQGYEELDLIFQSTTNLYGIEKVLGGRIAPNPTLKKFGRSTASDVIVDRDRILRRTVFYPLEPDNPSLKGFGLELAIAYLKKEKIFPSFTKDGQLQLSKVLLPPFESNDGGYQNADAGSYQSLINYRKAPWKRYSFWEILDGQVNPNELKDRIVLIGATSESKKDFFYTPYTQQDKITKPLFGVEVQAQIISQILSAVLDNRPLIHVWSELKENLWILSWIVTPIFIIWQLRQIENVGITLLLVIGGTAIAICFLLIFANFVFQKGVWIPFAPALTGLIFSTNTVLLYIYTAKHIQYHYHLKEIVKWKTHELEIKNQELTAKNQQLEATQIQLIAEKKLATLGEIILGVAHEIKNPLNLISNFTDLSFDLEQELQDLLENQSEYLEPDYFVQINETALGLFQNLQVIKQQTERTNKIIEGLWKHSPVFPMERQWVDLNKMMVEIPKLLSFNYLIEDLKVHNDFDESIEKLFLYPDFYQGLLNLIENALYTLQQKKKQLGKIFFPVLTLSTKNRENEVEIIVKDNGQGISPAIQERVFDSFVTTKPPGEGAGLGLSIVQGIVERHRGKLLLETQEQEFTKFTIILPKINLEK